MYEDRNLLLGLLAVQLEFVDRATLIATLDAWSVDKSRSLGQLLLAKGKLSTEELTLLESLVDKHVSRHRQDAAQSLQAVTAQLNLPGDWASNWPTTTAISRDGDATPPVTSSEFPPRESNDRTAERFKILRPYARGGLGQVSIALDQELQREVALKEIQPRFAADESSRSRFLFEAEVTGRLEHPGVVPVYGMGRRANGEPYYAMRFIQGESLQDALQRLHHSSLSHDGQRWELRKLLQRFVVVANVLAYAHSRGVLHRDLKPANIMLGRYGETLVVDWGLARVMDREQVENGVQSEFSNRLPAGSTLVGSILGTPAYMSPEQGAGQIDRLTPASDIYSLGATLYALLTGQASISETDPRRALDRLSQGQFLRPREVQAWIPASLEAICLRAMSLHPSGRYATAADMATDVERWLADEPVQAYTESLPARLGRWARRRRTFVAAAISLLLTATLGLSISTWALNRERQATQRERDNADHHFEQAQQVVDEFLTEVGTFDLVNVPQLAPQRQRLIEKARNYYLNFLKASADDPRLLREAAQAHANLGAIHRLFGSHDKALSEYRDLVKLVESRQKPNSWEPAGLQLASAKQELGVLLQERGKLDDAAEQYREARSVLQRAETAVRATSDYRRVLANLEQNQANLLRDQGAASDAIAALQQSITIRERIADEAQNDRQTRQQLSQAYANLGLLLIETRRHPEAEAALERSVRSYELLLLENPDELKSKQELAITLNTTGGMMLQMHKLALAESHLRRSNDLLRELSIANPGSPFLRLQRAQSLTNLGRCLLSLRRWDDALTLLAEAAELLDALHTDDEGNSAYLADLIRVRQTLSEAKISRGQFEPALQDGRVAVELAAKLAELVPESHVYQLLRSEIETGFAVLLGQIGVLDESEALLAKSIDRLNLLLAADGRDWKTRQMAGKALYSRGVLAVLRGRLDVAVESYRSALAFQQPLADEEPARGEPGVGAATSLVNLAAIQFQQGDTQSVGSPGTELEFAL